MLTIDTFFMCYIKPFNRLDPISKQGAFYQHVITRVIQFYFQDMSRFDKSSPYYSFVSNLSWKAFFNTRAFIQAYNVIELTTWENLINPRGLWITTGCRSNDHDIVLFHVPNFPLFGCQPYFYAEYMTTLHSLLLLQGFNSPAVFVMEFPESSKKATMEANLFILVESWNEMTGKYPNAKFVISGDSMGATLALRFLLYANKKFEAAKVNNDNKVDGIIKPFGGVIISPIVNFTLDVEGDFNVDILRPNVIDAISKFAYKDQVWNPCDVSDVDVWSDGLPKGGFILMWGDQEYQAKSLEDLSNVLKLTGIVKIVKGANRGHCWPFVSFLTEDTQDEKEDSCFLIAGMLSRMVLFHTAVYKDPKLAFEPMNLLTIDDSHL